MENEIREILKDAKLVSKPVNDGYDKEGFPVTNFVLYWDPYNHDYRSEDMALVGYVIKKLVPTIEKVIKYGNKV